MKQLFILLTILFFNLSDANSQYCQFYIYKLKIDCYANGVENAGTSNQIQVSWWAGDKLLYVDNSVPTCGALDKEVRVFQCDALKLSHASPDIIPYCSDAPTHVIIETHGTDAYWMDRLTMYLDTSNIYSSSSRAIEEGHLIRRWGRDGGKGWCMSKDASDADGAWKDITDGCHTALKFNIADGKVTQTASTGLPLQDFYEVRIDCAHNQLTNTTTTDNLTVTIYDQNNQTLLTKTFDGSVVPCDQVHSMTTLYTGVRTELKPKKVVIKIDGGDAFFVDQVQFYKNGKLTNGIGQNDGTGWCLSTDSDDANGSWKDCVASCQRELSFDLQEPSHDYRVRIDCFHKALSSEKTGNTITVELLDASGNILCFAKKFGVQPCSMTTPGVDFTFKTNGKVAKVRFKTSGDDGFYIDYWKLFKDGTEIHQAGGNGGNGWCLSTDPADANGSWNGNLSSCKCCKSSFTFTL